MESEIKKNHYHQQIIRFEANFIGNNNKYKWSIHSYKGKQ